MRRLLIRLATVALLPLAAAAQDAPKSGGKKAVQAAAPLAQFAGMKVAVIPVQFFRGDTAFATPAGAVMRAQFDTLLSTSIEEHGLKGMWATPLEVIRSGRRNVMYAGDPANMGAFNIRNGVAKDAQLPDPFAGNLRRIVALHDARYALVPIELYVVPDRPGGSLVVRLILVDCRLNQAVWQAELMGEKGSAFSPELIQKLTNRLAELAVGQ